MNAPFKLRKIVAVLAIAGVGAGSALALERHPIHFAAASPAQVTAPAAVPGAAATTAPIAATPQQLPDLRGLIARATPAVVHITVTERGRVENAADDSGMPPFWPFNIPFGIDPRELRRFEPRQVQGIGSGFVISPDGYIVTNHHVVDGATKITVKLNDKREFSAKLIGSDPLTDVAVIKVDATHLPTLTLGDSDALEVGQWVVAIGAPFGFERTATQGIVSALSRSLPDERYVPFIQTDAAVNPGNSGGPLLDLSGRVIGINSQIYSRSGGYMGVSFAIPIKVAMNAVDQIRTAGHVERGYLGVTLQPVSAELAKSFGVDKPRGALVSSVTEGSPAAGAGLKPGDIVTAYRGKAIADSTELPPMVGATKPGETVPLTVLRDGKERMIEVRVGALPGSEKTQLGMAGEEPGHGRLNVAVSNLTPEIAKRIGVKAGVVVEEVGPGMARDAGVQPGDVLVEIDRKPIRDVEQLKKVVRELPAGKSVPLLVKRGEGTLFLALSVPSTHG